MQIITLASVKNVVFNLTMSCSYIQKEDSLDGTWNECST